MKKFAIRLSLVLAAAGSYVAGGVALSACSAAWWSSLLSGTGAITSFIQYVQAFLGGIQSLWSSILALLPASAQAQAQTDFSNAFFTIEQSLQVLQDTLNAAAAAQGPEPNLTTLVANVQAAVDALMKIVEQWTGGSTSAPASDGGAGAATLTVSNKFLGLASQLQEAERERGVIKAWKP